MKKLLLLALIISLSFSTSFADHSNLESNREKLSSIKNGDKYISRIDSIFSKYSESITKLEIIRSRLNTLIESKASKTDSRSLNQLIILMYIDSLVDSYIYELNPEATTDKEPIEEESTENREVSYPGYDTHYDDTDKNIVAGESSYIYQTGIRSDLEGSDIGEIQLHFAGADISKLQNSIQKLSVYIDGSIVASSSAIDSQITGGNIIVTISNIDKLILNKKQNHSLRIGLQTFPIGDGLAGEFMEDLYVDKIVFDDIKGLESGKNISSYSETEDGELFSVVPQKGSILVKKEFSRNNSSSELYMSLDSGDNTNPDGSEIKHSFNGLDIEVSSFSSSGVLNIYNGVGDLLDSVSINSSGDYSLVFTDSVSDSGETYRLETSAQGIFRIKRDGVKINNYSSRFKNTLSLGQYSN